MRTGISKRLALCAVVVGMAQLLAAGTGAGKTWKVSGTDGFADGRLDGVSMLATGELVLGPQVKPIPGLEATYVWDIERAPDGRIFVGTGGPATVGVIEGGALEVLHRTSEKQVLSVLPLPDGSVLAATAPRGIIYRVDPAGTVTVFSELEDGYVWDMALGSRGEVYCATGPNGRLLELKGPGAAVREVFKAKQKHLLCVEADPASGELFVGTQPEGLVYRISPDGKVSVLFDAQEPEVRCLAIGPDGRLYAGTAQTEGSASEDQGDGDGPEGNGEAAAPCLPSSSDDSGIPNSVYRIDRDGAAMLLASLPGAMAFSLAPRKDGRVLIGTGPKGRLAAVDAEGRSLQVMTDFAAADISAMALADGAEVILGTSNGGGLWRISAGHRSEGAFQSESFDAGRPARWGRLWWRGDPQGGSLELSLRTGNSHEPDETWSDWSPAVTAPEGAAVTVPVGRFAQARCKFATDDPASSPSLWEVDVSYHEVNARPVVSEIGMDGDAKDEGANGPRPSASPGESGGARTVHWSAADANGDELVYDLYYRAVDESDWKSLKKDIAGETEYEWETDRVPEGHYLLRLVASDRLARPAGEAMEAEKISQPFVIDNRPPELADLHAGASGNGAYLIGGIARDGYSAIKDIKVSHNAADWKPVFPSDGIFDSGQEQFTYLTELLEPGEHVFVFAATDEAGNVGSGRVLVNVE